MDGVTVQDPTGRLLFANAAAAQLVGLSSPEELLTLPLAEVLGRFELFDEEGDPLPVERLPGRLALAGQEVPELTVRFRILESGEDRWAKINARPVYDEHGEVKYVLNIFRDVTDKITTRKELEAYAEKVGLQARLLEESASAVVSADLNGDITYWNRHAEWLYGWTSEEVLGRNFKDVIVTTPDEAVGEEIVTTVSGGGRWSGEWQTARKDGSRVSVHASISPLHDRRDQLIGIVAVSVDITGLKRAEEERSILYASEQIARLEAEAAAESLRAIQRVADAALGHLGLDDLLQELVVLVAEVLNSDLAILLTCGRRDELFVRACTGLPADMGSSQRDRARTGIAERIRHSRTPEAVEELGADELGISTPGMDVRSAAGVPLRLENRVLGVLLVGSTERRRFARTDLGLLQLVGDRIASAVEHARLFEAETMARRTAEQAVERVLTLQTVTAALSEALTAEQVAATIIDQGLFALGAASGSVALLDAEGDHMELAVAAGADAGALEQPPRFPLDAELPVAESLRTRRLIVVENSREMQLRYPLMACSGERTEAFMAIPLLLEERPLGALGFGFSDPRTLGEDERTFVGLLAQQCAQALDRARLYEAEARARAEAELVRERLQLLAEASEILASSPDYQRALSDVADLTVPTFADWCLIDLPDDPLVPDQIVIAHPDPSKVEFARGLLRRGPPDPTAIGVPRVLRSGRSELLTETEDLLSEAAAGDDERLRIFRDLSIRSALVVPLSARGKVLGAITFASSQESRRYGSEDLKFAEDLARRAATAIDNARLFREREEQENRLRQLVQSLDAIVWEADPETLKLRFVSRRAELILGYPVERWIDEADFWLRIVHQDDRQDVVEQRRKATAAGRDHEIDYRAVAADGRVVWLRDIVHVVPGEEGRHGWLRGVSVDITETKFAQQALQTSRERFAHLATTLQRSLLPPRLPDIPRVETAFKYRPAAVGNQVGGDFYDLFSSGDDEWCIVVGDVQGKGPRAAALTGLARHTIRAFTMRDREPVNVLKMLNEAVLREMDGETSPRFCTVVFGRLQPTADDVVLTLANSGHPQPLILYRDGAIKRVAPPGMLIGAFPDAEVGSETTSLAPGDAVVFFTDGVTDTRRGAEVFGEARLEEVVARCRGCRAQEIADAVERTATEFGSGNQDDIALFVMRVVPED